MFASLARYRALRIGTFPFAYRGLIPTRGTRNHHFASAPFPCFSAIAGTTPVNWQPVSETDKTGISRFNPLLQVVPNLVTKANVAMTQYVEVNIPVDSLAPVKGSLNELRGWTRDSNGRITEQAKLFSPENLRENC